MSRNVFDQSDEEPEKYTVPLKLGVGGPVIGEATVDKNGVVYGTVITDEEVKRTLHPEPLSLSLPDPADRYRVHPADEDFPHGLHRHIE